MSSTKTDDQRREYVAILDAGSQFGKVIDRKIRQLCVETVILPLDTPAEQLRSDTALKGVIITGGPSSVNDADAPMCSADLFTIDKPILGICYGMQLLVKFYGGTVKKGAVREDGQDEICVKVNSVIFDGMQETETVLLTHGDSVTQTGPQLRVIAESSAHITAAVEHISLPLYGVQFHPEVELTEHGLQIFRNFLVRCGCQFNFVLEDREAVALRLIQARAQRGQKVVCLVSGGVDSTVCAALVLKALGPERVVCIHVDHGFMRLDESRQVTAALEACGVRVRLIDAADQFAQATTEMLARGGRPAYHTRPLCETTDPEEKRTIIGNTFMTVCDDVFNHLGLRAEEVLLVQGTLRPDLIESGSSYASKKADAIKTHHNDTAVVRQLRDSGRVIEPLCDYHKDEVRELGVRLGLPRELVERQPFPGPGLAIRVLCSDGTPFRDEQYAVSEQTVKEMCGATKLGQDDVGCDAATTSSGAAACVEPRLSGCLLPVRTVGVQGDGRTYAYAAALTLGRMPGVAEWRAIQGLAKAIPKLAHMVNRVVFMFGPREESPTITTTPTLLTRDVVDKLRVADDIVNRFLLRAQLVRKLSQVPVILLPLSFDGESRWCVVIRTFVTNDFMTGVPALPGTELMPLPVLQEMVDALRQLPFVSRVMYDLTAKPPGTTEWE